MSDDPRENPGPRPEMPEELRTVHVPYFEPRLGKDYDPPDILDLENASGRYRCETVSLIDGICGMLLEPAPDHRGMLRCPQHPRTRYVTGSTPARPYTRIVLVPEAVIGIGNALDEMQPTPDMVWLPEETQRRIRVARQLLVMARGILHIPGEHYATIDDGQIEALERYLVQTTDLDFE